MADDRDDSQATEEPTAKRLEQARESGDVVKSSEVSTFVVLAGGTLAIAMFGRSTAMSLALVLAPFAGVMMLAALAGHVLQSRPGLSLERIKPDLSKLSIPAGLGRMF